MERYTKDEVAQLLARYLAGFVMGSWFGWVSPAIYTCQDIFSALWSKAQLLSLIRPWHQRKLHKEKEGADHS